MNYDVIIYCAGILQGSFNELMNVNFVSVYRICQEILTLPVLDRPAMVCVGSSSYSRGRGEHVIYSAAKAALCNMVQGLSDKHGQDFRINILNPSRTATSMRDTLDTQDMLAPQEVAQAIVILAQSYNTGQIIDIRRGMKPL